MDFELIIVALIVGAALFFMVRKSVKSMKGDKGSCRSCGDTCGCSLKDAVERAKKS